VNAPAGGGIRRRPRTEHGIAAVFCPVVRAPAPSGRALPGSQTHSCQMPQETEDGFISRYHAGNLDAALLGQL
jgi:hypothetical protein